jgi:serine/threonine protein kinase
MDDALAAGSRLGRYEIVRRLALGGMAEIYLARMTGLAGFAKHVVVKRILPSYARDAEFVRMFLNEARYAATLDHPNISHVYDFGEEGGLYYYAMEYLHGDDCRALLRELAVKQRRLPLELALTIAIGAATGCHFAHELVGEDGRPLGLIHRDVSPSNVVVTYAGAVKLVDFGIAKATARETATAAGVTKGKLAYMAPEQCRAERLDRRVDVYALGILLYELTTQRRAFAADNDAAIVWAVMSGNVTWPIERDPSYPPALDAIVRKAMHFDRDQRYATARELAVALEEFARTHDLLIGPTRLAEFFTEIMGPRLEPWRLESEGRAATATPTPGPLAATSVLGPASADVPTYTPPGVLGPLGRPPTAPSGARPSSGSAPAPAPSPAPSRAPWIALGLLAVVGGARRAVARDPAAAGGAADRGRDRARHRGGRGGGRRLDDGHRGRRRRAAGAAAGRRPRVEPAASRRWAPESTGARSAVGGAQPPRRGDQPLRDRAPRHRGDDAAGDLAVLDRRRWHPDQGRAPAGRDRRDAPGRVPARDRRAHPVPAPGRPGGVLAAADDRSALSAAG